jgi:hypothetical protein
MEVMMSEALIQGEVAERSSIEVYPASEKIAFRTVDIKKELTHKA